MTSTFHGLNTAYRGLVTQKGALNTVGHNVANASTPGYSRQRVNIQPTEPYPAPGINRPGIPGQIGTGAEAGTIQRIRENFLDMQFREETKKLGYYEARMSAIYKMEEVMKESLHPDAETGLSKVIDRFWQSLEDLHKNPTNEGARSVVHHRGEAIGETFHYLSSSLENIQTDLKAQLNVSTDRVNSLLKQINEVNKQIGDVEPHGYVPNDLYDKRDAYVDELSQYIDIHVERVKSGGNPQAIAEGKYTITLKGDNTVLIDGETYQHASFSVAYNEAKNAVSEVNITDATGANVTKQAHEYKNQGRLLGLVESYGWIDERGEATGLYPDMLQELDVLAYNFVTELNDIHQSGFTRENVDRLNNGDIYFNEQGQLVDTTGALVETGVPFFNELLDVKGAAKAVNVSNDIKNHLSHIATSGSKYYPKEKIIEGNEAIDMTGSFLGHRDGNNEYDLLHITQIDVDAAGVATVTATLFGKDATGNDIEKNVTLNGNDFFGLSIDTSSLNGSPFSKTYDRAKPNTHEKVMLAPGDNSNALALANFKNKEFSFTGATDTTKKTVHSYYAGVIGQLGVEGQEANRFFDSTKSLVLNVDKNRQSVSGVSLEEEMTDMIRYSQAFNAAARMITTMDQVLDKIINSMGLVGR